MAVVVQPLVPAEYSAVVFTADPAASAQARLRVRVDSAYGLGERLVSGRVTGDAHLVDRVTLRTLDFVRGDDGDVPVLSEAILKELVDLALCAERAFGHPLDVEAAFTADHGWWLTQARPITSSLT
jgi:pyruvate,water dikinase